MSIYEQWIKDNVPKDCANQCAFYTEKMQAAFPELIRVCGHYDRRAHWWCKTLSGEIVDPTARQFASGGEYVEFSGPEPTGLIEILDTGEQVVAQLS